MSKLPPPHSPEEKIGYTIDKVYLNELTTQFEVKKFDKNIKYGKNIKALRIKSCNYDKNDIISDSLKKVLNTFSKDINSLAMVFHRTKESTEIFMLIKNSEEQDESKLIGSFKLLQNSIQGNFPGIEIEEFKTINIIEDETTHTETSVKQLGLAEMKTVSCLINTPSENPDAHSTQNIERLLNGVVPQNKDEEYTIVILAEAIPYSSIWAILDGHEELASYIFSQVNIQVQHGENSSYSTGHTNTEGITESLGKATGAFVGGGVLGAYGGLNHSRNETEAVSNGKSDSESSTAGLTKSTSLNYKDYKQANLLERIEQYIARIKQGQATGLWNTSTYIFAKTPMQSKHVTQFYNSLSQSNTQYNEPFFTQIWNSSQDNNDFNEAAKYITHFCHPVLVPKKGNSFSYDGEVYSSSMLTTAEVSMLFSFPRYPIQGIPVFERTRFGREPREMATRQQTKGQIKVGGIQYLGKSENTTVSLDKEELTKHVFVTGSTGAGKSNTIYNILDGACPLDGKTKFMIIEPAKGEYKNIFGGREDVVVYGTNPYKVPHLLQINPFYFPPDIHVLEHIDRLVEVFNACWPMYAAMPAILKETIEKSYQQCGWNLNTSKPQKDHRLPTFQMLLKILPTVIQVSGYSVNTQNDYIGALHTRIRSLTTGLYGFIFNSVASSQNIFEKNVIIDLSRVGSQETKALFMGLLLLQLQEYRMSENKESNGELRHIAVLEEAHILLTRASTTQTQESANLQGKSVEMFANAIAEMRTYGQGFIIADQSPGLLDLSIIRNTNTKIIHRLLSLEDRELVGYAAGLNEDQIDELSKLECGVAAISHGTWIEPVLCKIDKFDKHNKLDKQNFEWENPLNVLVVKFFDVLLDIKKTTFSKDEYVKIDQWIEDVITNKNTDLKNKNTDLKNKNIFLKVIKGTPCSEEEKINIIHNIAESKRALPKDSYTSFIHEIIQSLYYLHGIEDSNTITKKIEKLFINNQPKG